MRGDTILAFLARYILRLAEPKVCFCTSTKDSFIMKYVLLDKTVAAVIKVKNVDELTFLRKEIDD